MAHVEESVMSWYEVINSLARFYADTAAAVESNPPKLCVSADDVSIPLATIVRDELVRSIFRWPQWQLLLQNSANGYIQPPTATMRTSRRVTAPTRSDDLLRPFEQCVRELDQFTRARAGEAIDGLLLDLADKVKSSRDALGAFCTSEAIRDQLKTAIGSECADLVDVLFEAADPMQLGTKLRSACLSTGMEKLTIAEFYDNEFDAIAPLNPAAAFPLPLGLKFGWSEEIWRELSPDQRSDHTHQSWVPRIRDTLISSVDEVLYGLVVEINARAVSNICKECNELSFLLQNEIVANNIDFMAALTEVLAKEPAVTTSLRIAA